MAVNRYDEAAPVQYVSQYVPIPFQELFAMAKYYGDEIKTARKELNDYAKSVGEFQSLLTKDVDSYHRIALNDNIRRIMDEAVANPSIMKNAAWRSSMASALNSVNYADLSKLKKSAEQADLYDKLYKSLAAQGKMPPGWEKDWYSTYDTLNENKIFDKTPLAYQSVDDLAWEYVKDLPDTYLETKGGYDWYGVSEKTALQQIGDNSHELFAHPVIQRHIEMLKSMGMDEKTAIDNVMNRAKLTALRKAHKEGKVNQYTLQALKYKNDLDVARAKAGLDPKNGSVLGREDMLVKDFKTKVQDIVGSVQQSDAEFNNRYNPIRQKIGEGIASVINGYMQDPEFNEQYGVYYDHFFKQTGDKNAASIIATQYALASNKNISPENKKIFSDLLQEDALLNQQMTDEALGRRYQSIFNGALAKSEGNPFESLKNETYNEWFGSVEFVSDAKYQHMWTNAIEDLAMKVSSTTAIEMEEELFGERKNGKDPVVNPKDLISPKQFIVSTNQYVRDLLSEAGFDSSFPGTKEYKTFEKENKKVSKQQQKINIFDVNLDRSSLYAGQGAQFNLEERLVKGDYGSARIDRVEGYIDTPDGRNYVVRVKVPIAEGSVFDSKMSQIFSFDGATLGGNRMGAPVSNAGYETFMNDEGGTDLYMTMIMPVKNKGLDKTRRNRQMQKDLGTTDTKNKQIAQDDRALQSDGYTISGGF